MGDLISRSSIYNYIKAQINPYGKPFKGTAYEFGLKVMDYIENATTVEGSSYDLKEPIRKWLDLKCDPDTNNWGELKEKDRADYWEEEE